MGFVNFDSMQRPLKWLLIGSLILSIDLAAQPTLIRTSDRSLLVKREDTLRNLSEILNTNSQQAARLVADSQFTRVLVRALQVPHSFHFPFDSLPGISKIYAPDSSFRIITWNILLNDFYNRQKGTLQMNTKDGSLKMFPLRDVSEFTEYPMDSVRNRMNWIGSVYYNMIRTQHEGKNYYTLFGFDPNSPKSSKKWMEVLHFNEAGEPLFGGPFFSFENDTVPRSSQYRHQLEFKKGAGVLMNFIPEMNMILVDHLISENDDQDNKWTYIPDGDQEGFVWKNGKWVHIEKVFTFKLNDGQAPREAPILDKKENKKTGND
jgi:hypothetical protein